MLQRRVLTVALGVAALGVSFSPAAGQPASPTTDQAADKTSDRARAPASQTAVRCVAGGLVLPAAGVWSTREDGVWAVTSAADLQPGHTGCLATRVVSNDTISGVIVFTAAPRTTPDGNLEARAATLHGALQRLASMNIAVGSPKWRQTDVPFDGLPGFGHATMFGFDGRAIEGDDRSDVIALVFEGPSHLYAISLVGARETDDKDAWRGAVAGFRAMLRGLNKVARP